MARAEAKHGPSAQAAIVARGLRESALWVFGALALILFVALALTAHAVGADEQATLGAQVFFWARLVYLPVYWAGITYVRSLIWGVGTVGLALMVSAIL